MKSLVFEASWDPEAEVWWTSETPVRGLVTEAATLDELHDKLSVMIPDMLGTEIDPLSIQVNSLKEY